MLGYYVKLAARSLRRNPGITSLMVLAIALGISVCVMMLTVYHGMSSNPIWWKNDRLYAVTLDSWDVQEPADDEHPDLPPWQLTYNDAAAVAASTIPLHQVRMVKTTAVLVPEDVAAGAQPERVMLRVTSADFFTMFDTPFLYGSGWQAAADAGPEPVIVLSREMNEKFFAGENSVGRILRWNDRAFRVTGVLDDWHPSPKFYDLNNGGFDDPEDAYVPFGWIAALELRSMGNTNCWKPESRNSYADFLNSECVWIQSWVELPDAAARASMQVFLDAYVADQRKAGRFARPDNNRLTPVDQWLADNRVVRDDNRLLVALAFAFLAVCLLNTVGLLLAKFLGNASVTGIRRALGASRRQVFLQHLTEAGLLAAAGALGGLVLAALGLLGLRALYATGSAGFRNIMHVDGWSLVMTVMLAVFAALAAGLYPAWRVGRLAPAVYLKTQ
ncbi:MAG: ABC transporter permease [Steroidobacteraceae bacterium]|nr:ABC transporter permease [Steroidobacteraceae bacterium]